MKQPAPQQPLLRRLRCAKRWTQAELAEMVGLRQRTVSRLELGQSGGRPDTLARLAAIFEVPVSALTEQS